MKRMPHSAPRSSAPAATAWSRPAARRWATPRRRSRRGSREARLRTSSSGGAADELGRKGLLRDGSKVELALSQIGMVVRAGAVKPDIGSVDAVRRTLLAAKSIGYSDSGSGTYLSNTMFEKIGVKDQVAGKSRKVRGPPSGEPVAAVVARGELEIGFQQVSELIHTPGVTFVGALPAELQPGFSFAAAITRTARDPKAAEALIRFLSSPEAASTITKAGLTPVAKR
jgi:molybdate transport system substrate-binding protein